MEKTVKTTSSCISAALQKWDIMSLSTRTSKQLTAAAMAAYANHHLNKEDVGGEALSDQLRDAICEAIGDDAYRDWMIELMSE